MDIILIWIVLFTLLCFNSIRKEIKETEGLSNLYDELNIKIKSVNKAPIRYGMDFVIELLLTYKGKEYIYKSLISPSELLKNGVGKSTAEKFDFMIYNSDIENINEAIIKISEFSIEELNELIEDYYRLRTDIVLEKVLKEEKQRQAIELWEEM